MMMMYDLLLLIAGLKLQSFKKDGCSPSSVIKIVKMKYNRIDINDLFQPHLKCTLQFFQSPLHHVHDFLLQHYFTQVNSFSCSC
jgi:hypothetical protein